MQQQLFALGPAAVASSSSIHKPGLSGLPAKVSGRPTMSAVPVIRQNRTIQVPSMAKQPAGGHASFMSLRSHGGSLGLKSNLRSFGGTKVAPTGSSFRAPALPRSTSGSLMMKMDRASPAQPPSWRRQEQLLQAQGNYQGWMAAGRRPQRRFNRASVQMAASTVLEGGTEIEAPENVVIVTETEEPEYQVKYNTDQLRQEEYTRTIDPARKIDENLKLGTGDDELVETIVKTAKTGMGLAGAFVPDQVVTDTLKTGQPEKREKTYADNMGYISKLRDQTQSKLVDAEGLPLVYSQQGI